MNVQTQSGDLISAARVEGSPVFNTSAEHLGTIRGVMLHKLSGEVAYAVLAFGGVLGLGEKHYPLPWSALKYDVALGGYVVPYAKDKLQGAPGFTDEEIGEDDSPWRARVYDFYGAAPYWY
jgi:hypothetical protein